jgi:hypothetical protein
MREALSNENHHLADFGIIAFRLFRHGLLARTNSRLHGLNGNKHGLGLWANRVPSVTADGVEVLPS